MTDSASKSGQSRKRPWLALVLTILLPGLGHVYLRLWLRSALWLALYLAGTSYILPDGATPEEFSVDAFVAAGEAVPLEAGLLVLGISVVCLVDVYMMTSYINDRVRRVSRDSPENCPHCGKELDDDLSFCHWCTTELDDPAEN